ncbi:MAG: hypothetical protein H6765_05365 [Candidatus Peribacteria bacterium]|nr:MAG: hypothetical protein H6765_05365 [Candidatus Peribacteria bacterium]
MVYIGTGQCLEPECCVDWDMNGICDNEDSVCGNDILEPGEECEPNLYQGPGVCVYPLCLIDSDSDGNCDCN